MVLETLDAHSVGSLEPPGPTRLGHEVLGRPDWSVKSRQESVQALAREADRAVRFNERDRVGESRARRNSETDTPAKPAASAKRSSSEAEIRTSRRLSFTVMPDLLVRTVVRAPAVEGKGKLALGRSMGVMDRKVIRCRRPPAALRSRQPREVERRGRAGTARLTRAALSRWGLRTSTSQRAISSGSKRMTATARAATARAAPQ